MKKKTLGITLAVIALCVTAYGFIQPKEKEGNCAAHTEECQPMEEATASNYDGLRLKIAEGPDFPFAIEIAPRFYRTVTLEQIQSATTIEDLIPTCGTEKIVSYDVVNLSTFMTSRSQEVRADGSSEFLSFEQLALFQSMDHTSDFYITGNVTKITGEDGQAYKDTLIGYYSIAPSVHATCQNGIAEMEDYFRLNSFDDVSIARKDKTAPGRVIFTVAADGSIQNIELENSCGYNSIDERMLELTRNMPQTWIAGRDSKGNTIPQKLVLSFGQIGC